MKNQQDRVDDRKEISTELAMGGQAVIEGVMMRSPYRVAVAVRKPDGEIAVKTYPYTSVIKRIKWLGWPIVRGAVGMVESLKIGVDALNWSAEQSMPSEDAKSEKKDTTSLKTRIMAGFSIVVAFTVGLGLFMYFPYWVSRITVGEDQGQFLFHLLAGAIRIGILLGYMWVISLMKDIHRVFQYHGAEHKTIFAYEMGRSLVGEQVSLMTRFHPRCGTSFLLIVALSAVLFFAIFDSIVVAVAGPYGSTLQRFLIHLPLIPVLAGVSYELLKYSAKHTKNRFVWAMIQPGLWLQRITTQEPDQSMCEVAIASLQTAMKREEEGVSVTVVPGDAAVLPARLRQAL